MKQMGYILGSLFLLCFAACSGGGSASDYFTPGITTTPPTLEAAEGEIREAFTAIAAYSYGQVTTPVNATFTLRNAGDYSAKLTRSAFGDSQFSFLGGSYPGTGGTCTTTVKSGAKCTIVVRFAPVANQSITALMSLYYDSRDGETSLDILLSGSGGSTPVISNVSPISGLVAGGTTITIAGSGFLSELSIAIGGSACTSVSVINSSQVTCVSPAHASGLVDVVLTNPDSQRATYSNGFRYVTAPALANISDQTVNENAAISQINPNDGGDDFDADGDAINYTCVYDTTVDGSVAGSTVCTSLSGLSFTGGTGVIDWTPSYSQGGSYEFKVTGSDGSLSDTKIFSITVSNVNQAPSLANISNQSANENVAITQVNANDGGDDLDADGDTVTYTCYYDNNVDGAVAAATTCASLTGVSFTAATGVMDWTPSYTQSGSYELKITGSDGSLSDNKIFTLTVFNVNRTPSLTAISDQSVNTGVAITQVNADDGGDDLDVDGDAITYTCYYDTTVDGAVAAATTCASLSGSSFTAGTGVFSWTPVSVGSYEMKITGSDGSLSDDEIFVVTVSNGWAETKLTASDGGTVDAFGTSVAISDTSVIVGAYGDVSETGSAYLYQYDPSSSTWNETKLTASDGSVGDVFGSSVGISGTTAIVGAYGDATVKGAAYLYRLDPSSNTWAETKLTASDGNTGDAFGNSVAISGTTAIVGASEDDSAYLYQWDPSSNTWMETKVNGGSSLFGASVAISGTTAIVGANWGAGAAYIYQLDPSSNTWMETALTASDGVAPDAFGISVGISGTTAIVGAWGDDSVKGSAYIYRLDPSSNTWAETKLTASDGAASDYFGGAVAISGTTAVVGASETTTANPGKTYIYRLDPSSNTWTETMIAASDAANWDVFGGSVAISGTTAIIGAYGDASNTGAAYVYKFALPAAETKLTASDGGGKSHIRTECRNL